MRKSNICYIIAIILSDVMCADVAASYVHMLYGIKYEGYSASAELAFIYAIKYVIAIIICIILGRRFKKKEENQK